MTCTAPVCLACNVAKARRQTRATGRTTHADPGEQNTLSQNVLHPGQRVFVDQYESSVRGCLPTTQGLESPLQQYCGGTLFFDVASQFIYVRHQVSLGATDTLLSKNLFEREVMHCGRSVALPHQ